MFVDYFLLCTFMSIHRCWKDISSEGGGGGMGSSMDRKLLVWCQDSAAAAAPHLGGRRVKIDNLSSSFVDGWAFAGRVTALSHPGGQRADAPPLILEIYLVKHPLVAKKFKTVSQTLLHCERQNSEMGMFCVSRLKT